MGDLTLKYVNLEQKENQRSHHTEDFVSDSLVVRRGQPFKLSLQLGDAAFRPGQHRLIFQILLGRLYVQVPVTYSKPPSQPDWGAYYQQSPSAGGTAGGTMEVTLCTPASAPVGLYKVRLHVLSHLYHRVYIVGEISLLCNPWCQDDAVYLPLDSQKEEYVLNDFGLLYVGTPGNVASRPWSFDQYESEILQVCMGLLEVSPQHQQDWKEDYLNRSDPVYISRVVTAMINSQDDLGVLMGKWSGSYDNGMHPTKWSGSGDILRQWAKSNFRPVKYGQCWVFAAVMCTVMRVLGIPCRVVTNFNSAHDTNANLVIEEYYTIMGEKLPASKDSIWNFHVWVESWMRRVDLGMGFDGWQVLDPTPQERSDGIFRCGPAPVRAVRDKQLSMAYDVPFVFAEMNAEVHTFIVRNGESFLVDTDSDRVGALICTKAIGSSTAKDITATYKAKEEEHELEPFRTSRSRGPSPTPQAMPMSINTGCSQCSFGVSLKFHHVPKVGDDILFTVVVTNQTGEVRRLREHVNAQVKEYSNSPADTFWQDHRVMEVGPHQTLEIPHQIPEHLCAFLTEDNLVNLAVVIEDESSQERVLAYEEFNLISPEIVIEVQNEENVQLHKEHQAQLVFSNPFKMPIAGVLSVAGSSLLESPVQIRILALQPGETMKKSISFTPKRMGLKMLHSSLTLSNMAMVIRGFKTIKVQAHQ
ncbi:transglutaminase 5, like [Engraulis encrasicolus]|uniref:transglutaminase 5, like n=1 Tax=Engraulis encrasicolus TaxID=184585 RepID=UPI002FD6D8F7